MIDWPWLASLYKVHAVNYWEYVAKNVFRSKAKLLNDGLNEIDD